MNKLSLTLLVSVLCVLPAAAQNQGTPRPQANQSLETQVERAVAQSSLKQHEQGCSCETKSDLTNEPLSLEELIEAEEELSKIRSTTDPNATFEAYPYLLNLAYRRRNDSVQTKSHSSCSCKAKKQQKEEEPLDPHELIEAEEELSQIRSTIDPNATFEAYPYLLDPAYRRANETSQQSIRRPYTQSTWARKVGI